MTSKELRPHLLKAALSHVIFDGWSDLTLSAAAFDLGLTPERAELAFPRKGKDLLFYFLEDINTQHRMAIQEEDLTDLKIRDKIATCLNMRFDLYSHHKEAIHRAVPLFALPSMLVQAAQANWNVADIIWTGIGDTSTDHNYYTKRLTLAGVYAAGLIYWLSDTSDHNADTRAFINRRLETVMTIEKIKVKGRRVKAYAPSVTRFLGRLRYGSLL